MNPSLPALACALLYASAIAAVQAAPTPCDDAATSVHLAGALCAIEHVKRPSGGDVDLFVRTFPAQGTRRGAVWLVAGGPGESGASFYGLAERLRATFPGFDLIIPDHRGTGFSTRMCPQEEAPASPGGAALENAEWGTCFGRLNARPALAQQFSQTEAAYDLKTLLARAPRRGKTFVYGVSYGTGLVLRTLALGAPRIDGVILDSLVPLADDGKADLSRRSLVVDAVGRRILADCDATPACRNAIGEPVAAMYRRVLDRAGQDPALLAKVPGKNPPRFFASLLDVPGTAAQIPWLIKELDKELDKSGDTRLAAVTAEVEAAMAQLGSFPQSPPSMPLVILVSGSENNLQPGRTAQDVRAEEAGLLFSSSLPGYLVDPPIPLYQRDAWFARLPARLPPMLVVQGTRDAKTPYDAALRHIAALRRVGPVQLYTVSRGAHFALWSDSGCAQAAMQAFVTGGRHDTRCASTTLGNESPRQ